MYYVTCACVYSIMSTCTVYVVSLFIVSNVVVMKDAINTPIEKGIRTLKVSTNVLLYSVYINIRTDTQSR